MSDRADEILKVLQRWERLALKRRMAANEVWSIARTESARLEATMRSSEWITLARLNRSLRRRGLAPKKRKVRP